MKPDLSAGMALAATVQGDRDGAQIARALDEGLRAEFLSALSALREAERPERERMLSMLASHLRPAVPADAVLPARAASLLSSKVPRAIGATWAGAATPPRRGFRLHASLRAALKRLAADAPDPAKEGPERGRGRALVWAMTQGDPSARAAALAKLDPGEAAAVASLGALIDTGGDPVVIEDLAWVRALFELACARAEPTQITTALGAMELGAREGGRGTWRRAGVEAARVWSSSCHA